VRQLAGLILRALRNMLPRWVISMLRNARDAMPLWVSFRRVPGGYELRPWYRKFILNRF
jgi:hypothetical protein